MRALVQTESNGGVRVELTASDILYNNIITLYGFPSLTVSIDTLILTRTT